MENVYILAHDVGTSGIKTSIVTRDASEIDSMTFVYPTLTPRDGWAEQEPEQWWRGVVQNTRNLVEKHASIAAKIMGIGVSGHMLGCVAVDINGNPLGNSLIHSDSRAINQCKAISSLIGKAEMYRITGNILDPKTTLCKILWIKQNKPELFRKTEKFLQCKDFIVSRLTGNIDSTDLSDASHAQLLDVCKRIYAAEMLSDVGISMHQLPAVHQATDIIGGLSRESAKILGLVEGIPVIAGGGDGACANVGAGISSPGDTYCNLGTTAWIATLSVEPVIDNEQRIFNILSLDGETSGIFGTMQTAGRAIEWIMDVVGEKDVAHLNRMITDKPAGSDGLVFLPYLEGERSPIFDPKARGVFFGLSTAHDRHHLTRAVMEGVTFGLKSILDVFRCFMPISEMALIGGGANSEIWRRMIADILQVRLLSLDVKAANATSIGVALAVAVGIGCYNSLHDAVGNMVRRESNIPDSTHSEIYEKNYSIYKSLYLNLKDIFAVRAQTI